MYIIFINNEYFVGFVDLTRIYGFKIRANFLIIFPFYLFGTEWRLAGKRMLRRKF